MLAAMWMLSHALTVFLYWRPTFNVVGICILAFLLPVYIFKGPSFDLLSYLKYIRGGQLSFELGFSSLIKFHLALGLSAESTLLSVQFILGLLCLLATMIWGGIANWFSNVLVTLLSVSFFMGTQNVIRQSFSSVFLVIGVHFLCQRRHYSTLIFFAFVAIAMLFHRSGIIFGFFCYVCYLMSKGKLSSDFFVLKLKCNNIVMSKTSLLFFWGALILGFFSGCLSGPLLDVMGYSAYGTYGVPQGRISLFLKTGVMALILILSEAVLGSAYSYMSKYNMIRLMRITIIGLLLGISFFEEFAEVGARILYFYFLIETMLIAVAISLPKGFRIASLMLLVSYAFAVNVYKVLG